MCPAPFRRRCLHPDTIYVMSNRTCIQIRNTQYAIRNPTVGFVTLGCKVNGSDTQRAIADFRDAGFRIVPTDAPADVYVVNTCSVTHIAGRGWLRRGARLNPDALVVTTGCYAESGRAALEEMPEVGLVVGYKEKDRLLGLALDRISESSEVQSSKFKVQSKIWAVEL